MKLQEAEGICPHCNNFVGFDNLTMDHILPVSKAPAGTIYTIDDVQPLCLTCNIRKGNKKEGNFFGT